jgi:tetratricopeptide (TPR) repeat protein
LLGKNHTDTARSHHLIGTTLTRKGELDAAAIEHQQKALAILDDNVRGSNVLLAAQSYEGAVALSLIMRYDFVGALENYRKSLKLHTTVYRNRGHLDTSRAYEGVGYSLGAKDDVEGALKNHRMSLRIRLKLVGKSHHLTAASYYEIALLLERKGGKAAAFQNY